MKVDIFNTGSRYDIVYTDPPWPQQKGNLRKARPNQGKALAYQTCSMDDIKFYHMTASTICNYKHNIFMWTIDKFLHESEMMMRELGYILHTRIIWDKTNGVAPAFTVRFSHEYLLWFYNKGSMLMPVREERGKLTTVIREPATTHSTKPLAAYEFIERLFPDTNKIELFARGHREGWDCWGNQC